MSAGMLPDRLRTLGETIDLPSREERTLLARHELLGGYFRRRLLEGLAEEAEEILPDADALHKLAERLGLGSEAKLDTWLSRVNIDLDLMQAMATFPERLRKATETLWGESVPSRFLERRADLDQVVLSMVRFKDPDLAQELYFQLKEAEISFCDLVERYATGPDQLRRGLLGPVSLNRLQPVLAKVVERYPEQALVPPIDLDGTVHLIRVEAIQRAELNETVREKLLLELRNSWLSQQLQTLRQRLLESETTTTTLPTEVDQRS